MTQTRWHTLTLSAVTPAFLGRYAEPGDKGDKGDKDGKGGKGYEIPFPVPSLRGALGYWLRALAGAHVGDNLASLGSVESAVFGSARSGGSVGMSTIWIRGREPVGVGRYKPSQPVAYLMGPGFRDDQTAPAARHLKAGTTIRLDVRNTGGTVHADLFLCALWALRTFGGIGARARRGFGTISVDDRPLQIPRERFDASWLYRNAADDLQDVLSCVGDCLGQLGIPGSDDTAAQPGYPRFDLDRAWYLLGPDIEIPGAQGHDAALAWTGERLREFRLDGGECRNTAGWREIVQPYLDGGTFSAEFRAGALGLPVVYTQKATRPGTHDRSATVEPVVDGQPSRRASPLWLRVHRTGRTWWLRSLAFNAEFLPEGGNGLRVKATKGPEREVKPVTPPSPEVIRCELERWFSYVSGQRQA
ncbi:MAG TPA: RAMP superfamily CRISPR-associated protein [Trebonia sp.]|nr:RAMP superfamily CRISPR-associated protein [Trebonia sp.]